MKWSLNHSPSFQSLAQGRRGTDMDRFRWVRKPSSKEPQPLDLDMFPDEIVRELEVEHLDKRKDGDILRFINHQDVSGRTALHFAASKQNLEVLQFLVNAGGNLFIRDKKDQVAFEQARDTYIREYIFQEMNGKVMKFKEQG